MRKRELQPLEKLASLHGIQTSYVDVGGTEQNARAETLTGLLACLDVPATTPAEIENSLQNAQQAHWGKSIDPVIVAWDGGPRHIDVRIPEKWSRRNFYCHLQLENGETRNWTFRIEHLRRRKIVEVAGVRYFSGRLPLPRMPIGYHRFELGPNDETSSALVIAAPRRSYSSPELADAWGAFLPMYAAHSESSWGAGNFRDWQRLADWVSGAGGKIVGSLPILASFLGKDRCEPSPYSPASRLFWNEFFIDVTSVPEFAACPVAQKLVNSAAFQRQLMTFRKSRLVDYCSEMAARRSVLEKLSEFFFSSRSARRRDFERFLRAHPQLRDYAAFRAADEKAKTSWHSWPLRMREGNLSPGDYVESTARYHMYVQWLAQEQIDEVLAHCRSNDLHFYLDLPLGVNPDGYDVWRDHEAFALKANAGAPPDAFFTKGQDWGFAPLHPGRIREQGYRYVLEMLRFQMRHTGLLRIDHVMGLRRLYWIPKGRPASDGAYVSYPAEDLYAIVSLESHRHKTVIVGENLGTVPPEVNSAMARHHLRKMFVVQYELRADPKDALSAPARRMVASLNTHDMPSFAAFWKGEDLADRTDLGLITKSDLKKEREARRKLTGALAKFLKRGGWLKTASPDPRAALQACLEFLADSRAEILLVNVEDLWLETLSQNVPGTCSERPNWRRKAKYPLEQITQDKTIAAVLERIDCCRKKAAKR